MSSNLVNSSIIMYISFTFLFFVLKFRFFPENGIIWILVFLVISCIFQILQNITITSSPSMCGKPDLRLAIYSTVMPWCIIFAVFMVAITAIPGWLRIFSNTFGLFAAEAYGLKLFVNNIMQKPLKQDDNIDYQKMLDNIYTDRTALVLELDIDNVTMTPEFKFPALEKLAELKFIRSTKGEDGKYSPQDIKNQKDLYYALLLRENVGFFFWFLLIGIFCILVSTNTLLASNCTPTIIAAQNNIFA